jgi:beta-1,4-N-acetylglucosaminyltransferase
MAPEKRCAGGRGGGARPRSPAGRAASTRTKASASDAQTAATTTARRGGRSASTAKESGGKTAFVTVGTTRFDALVAAVDAPAFKTALAERGFSRLVVQAGAYEAPAAPAPPAARRGGGKRKASPHLSVDRFAYAPSLAAHMAAADLVISHAGAGSLFEALRGGKPTIAVPNPALMGDHQGELARTLAAGGHVTVASPSAAALVEAVRTVNLERRAATWEAGSPAGIVAALDELSGRTRKKQRV